VLLSDLAGHPSRSVFDFKGRVAVCKVLAEAGAAREAWPLAADWILNAADRISRVLVGEEMLSQVDAVRMNESAAQMASDIQSREGGDAITIDALGIFARPQHCIQLLTVHKAKGREFEAVAVIDAHDGRFPHFSINDISDEDERQAKYDESRRVVYVAATRAMRLLMFFSDRTHYKNRPTPFLAEMGL
jgi:DNA helicase-2/ATP-dependent DNA helicase PcrA